MARILRILDPTMKLDDMSMLSTKDPDSPIESTERIENQKGALLPMIMVNRYVFSADEVVSMVLDETGFLPTLSVSVACFDGVFLSTAYPKDGDPLSLFIRSKMDEFHPIRMDFIIRNVISSTSTSADGNTAAYTFHCVMRVTEMFTDRCRAFRGTSFDVLKEVARGSGLGFASNEVSTNDEMTWLQSYDPGERFVSDVASAAYLSDDSFLRVFVDRYYVMNLVNVNAQLAATGTIERALNTQERSEDYFGDDKVDKTEGALLVTNQKDLRGSSAFIASYTMVSGMGEVLIQNGYRRYAQFYEQFEEAGRRYQSQFVEPLTSEGTTSEMLLQKGRDTDGQLYKDWNKYKWLGRQSSRPKGNVHPSYKYAIVQNLQNQREIDKYELKTVLGVANFNIYRGMQVPVVIVTEGNMRSRANRQEQQEEDNRFTYDKFLSGFYYVKGMKLRWSDQEPQFRQELILSRREWPKPVTMAKGDGEAPPSM